LAVLLLVVAGCGEANVDASTTPPGDASSTTSTVITSTTAADTTTTTESTTTTEAVTGQIVEVVFASADQSDCSNTETFERIVNEAADPIESAFLLLVAGPTREEQTTGAGSYFSSDTEGMVRSVTVAGGLLTVDFEDLRPVIPNASTSCGSFSLLAQLNGTAFQFEEVDRVSYQIEGSCQAFFSWLQRDCQEYPRP
jgi:spore germination protein GerM